MEWVEDQILLTLDRLFLGSQSSRLFVVGSKLKLVSLIVLFVGLILLSSIPVHKRVLS